MGKISAVVAGTGFEGRDSIIRTFCCVGSKLQLRREPNNVHDPNAIGVWLECKSLFGLVKSMRQIGYVKALRAEGLSKRLDSGKESIVSSWVHSYYAPIGESFPRVSITIELGHKIDS